MLVSMPVPVEGSLILRGDHAVLHLLDVGYIHHAHGPVCHLVFVEHKITLTIQRLIGVQRLTFGEHLKQNTQHLEM